MNNLPSSSQTPNSEGDATTRRSFGRVALALGFVAFGVFYMMLAMGGASFVHECETLVCGQLHQAVFATIGALALFVSAYRLLGGMPSAAAIVFFGTLPILVVHTLLVITDPDEAIFFPLSTTPPPLIAGAVLVYRAMRRKPSGARGPR